MFYDIIILQIVEFQLLLDIKILTSISLFKTDFLTRIIFEGQNVTQIKKSLDQEFSHI